ncbi:protein DFG10 [Aspergillus granulosus]|uniref:Polyprenal reductase n=1 Tax=Aspergillus granulosus TaxID=176169 RepID=A0ABR4I454_9EURO
MDFIARVVDNALSMSNMDAVDALRAFFIFAACTILSVSLPNSLRSRFIPYGARATSTATVEAEKPVSPTSPRSASPVTRALDYVATLRVPHSYFTQFYVVSVLSSIFWAVQLLWHGAAFQAIATRVRPERLHHAISINQVMLCWGLMLIQGLRRLYECLSLSKPSTSRMWFVHWLAGIAFYLTVAVAIWIEGAGTVLSHTLSLDDFSLATRFSGRTLVCIPIFILASGIQHDCHHYLYSLKRYTLPTHPMFSKLVCPHYTAECMIYLSIAVLAAPQGEIVNKTVLSALTFVVINLGITASTTREWYRQKFGEEAVRGKWNMIPIVY